MPKPPAAPTQRPVGLPEHPKIPRKHPSRPTLPPPNRPLPGLPRPSRLPTAQPTKKPVGYKPVPPPKATPRPSVVKKQPTPNKGMQMDDVKRIQQAAYARGQKDGRKTGQAQGYQAGDRHGRKIGQEAGNREGFSKGQKQGYTQGHKSGRASGQTQGYAKGQATGRSQGFDAGQRRGHVSGHRQGYYQGQHAGYSQGEHFGYHYGYQQRRDEEHDNNTTAIAGGVAAGAMLGGTFMYLGHEALDPDGLSQVTEETESVTTEMEMSDDDFAPGEPVEDEEWYERHRTEWDSDEAYARPYDGLSGQEDESFYRGGLGGAYIGGGYEGSDGYDTNQDVRDDSQVHLSQEYEAKRGGFIGGEHSGSADHFHEKGRGEEDCNECDNCCGCGDSWFCVSGDNKKDNGGCTIM